MNTPIVFDENAKKVLSKEQQKLSPLLEDFSRTHFLAGGTAVALWLWHRESIDFDFFSRSDQGTFATFTQRIGQYGFDVSESDKERFAGAEFETQDEIHVSIAWVRVSVIDFFRTLYTYQEIRIQWDTHILGGLRIANLEELTAMKLFAMITRKKWKDAVDLYFLLHHTWVSLSDALTLAEEKYFIRIWNRSAILEQLVSMDWDTTESVHYLTDTPPTDTLVSEWLRDEAMKVLGE